MRKSGWDWGTCRQAGKTGRWDEGMVVEVEDVVQMGRQGAVMIWKRPTAELAVIMVADL
jgi:hypothetical protein